MTVSHAEPILVPAGRSNSTRQDDRAVVSPALTTIWPLKPVPQSDILLKVAMGLVAACAVPAKPANASAVAHSRMPKRRCFEDIRIPFVEQGRYEGSPV